MKSLWVIFKWELGANILSYKFLIAIIILFGVFILSLMVLAEDYNRRLEDYQALGQSDQSRLALYRPSPLIIFSSGLSDQLYLPYNANFFNQIESGTSEKQINWLFRMFEPPDSVYIFRIIVTLLAVFFTFDSIIGERERGTLRACLANPISRASYITAKILANFFSLAIPCMLILTVGIMYLWSLKNIQFTGGDLLRLGCFLIVSFIFIGVYVAMGVCVSAKTSSSSKSLVILLGLWILTTYCIPGISSSLSQSLAPAPESGDVQRKQNAIWISGVFKLEQESQNGNFTMAQRQQSNRDILAETRRLENEYFSKLNEQNRLFRVFARVSPASSYVELSTSILGSGLDVMNHIRKEIRSRRDILAEQEDSDILQNNMSGHFLQFGQSLANSAWSLTILILTGVLLFIVAVVIFNNSIL